MYPYRETANFEGHKDKTKSAFCDSQTQIGDLKRVWIALQNNGCQSYQIPSC